MISVLWCSIEGWIFVFIMVGIFSVCIMIVVWELVVLFCMIILIKWFWGSLVSVVVDSLFVIRMKCFGQVFGFWLVLLRWNSNCWFSVCKLLVCFLR